VVRGFLGGNMEIDIVKEKKSYFASFMLKLMVSILIIFGVQLLIGVPVGLISGIFSGLGESLNGPVGDFFFEFANSGILNTITSILTHILLIVSDAAGALTLYLLTRKSASPLPRSDMKFGTWIVCFLSCFGIGGIGSIIGAIVTVIILLPAGILSGVIQAMGSLSGGNVVDSLLYADDSWAYLIVGIISVGIIIPILEELIFRKLLIDSTSKYGFGAAILLSAFTFGIFHGNFTQFFYATALGLLFAYIYASTGKLRYSVLLHMGYNLYASAVIPIAKKLIPAEATEQINVAVTEMQTGLNNAVSGGNDAMVSLIMDKYLTSIEMIIERYPMVIFGFFAVAIVYILYFVLIIAGIIMIIVFSKKALNHRKTMMLGNKETGKCASFNWASIVFWVIGGLFFTGFYLLQYIAVIFSSFTGVIT